MQSESHYAIAAESHYAIAARTRYKHVIYCTALPLCHCSCDEPQLSTLYKHRNIPSEQHRGPATSHVEGISTYE